MIDNNVFVEVFTGVLNERLVPIAKKEDIEPALKEVSAANELYVSNSQLSVPEEWLAAMTVDFGDWLCDHIPSATEADICCDFCEEPIIAQYQMYAAGERVSTLSEILDECGGCPQDVDMAARGVADSLSRIKDPMTITYVCGSEDVDTFYVPACEESEIITQVIMDEQPTGPATPRMMGWLECYHAALHCSMGGAGAITVCAHEKDSVAIGAIAIVEGRAWIVPGDIMGTIMMALVGNPEEGQTILSNLASFLPGCDFENLARVLAACIMSAATESVEAAHRRMAQLQLDSFKVFSVNPCVTSMDFENNCTVHIMDPETAMSDLPNLFDAVIDVDPFLTGADASECVSAAAITRAACEIIMEGDVIAIAEAVKDFVMFMELDSNNRPFDKFALMLLSEYDEFLAEQSMMTTMSAMYEELESDRKSEIDVIVNAMAADPASFRSILAIEGDGHDHQHAARAHSAFMPPSMPHEAEEASKNRLRSLCTQCMLSPRMTMFLVKRPMNSSPVLISGIDWDGGKWEDLGPDRTLEFLDGTNIGEFLNVSPNETLDYQKIDRPSHD